MVRYCNGTEGHFDLAGDPGEQRNLFGTNEYARTELDAAPTTSQVEGLAVGHIEKAVPDVKPPRDSVSGPVLAPPLSLGRIGKTFVSGQARWPRLVILAIPLIQVKRCGATQDKLCNNHLPLQRALLGLFEYYIMLD